MERRRSKQVSNKTIVRRTPGNSHAARDQHAAAVMNIPAVNDFIAGLTAAERLALQNRQGPAPRAICDPWFGQLVATGSPVEAVPVQLQRGEIAGLVLLRRQSFENRLATSIAGAATTSACDLWINELARHLTESIRSELQHAPLAFLEDGLEHVLTVLGDASGNQRDALMSIPGVLERVREALSHREYRSAAETILRKWAGSRRGRPKKRPAARMGASDARLVSREARELSRYFPIESGTGRVLLEAGYTLTEAHHITTSRRPERAALKLIAWRRSGGLERRFKTEFERLRVSVARAQSASATSKPRKRPSQNSPE